MTKRRPTAWSRPSPKRFGRKRADPAQLPRRRPRSSVPRSRSSRCAICSSRGRRTRRCADPPPSCGSGWTAMCCTINNGSNTCPPGSIAGRLVEGRQLGVLRRQLPLLHRLQRQRARVRVRRERHLRPRLPRVQMPLRDGHVRRAARVLQRVPLRPVPSGDRRASARSCAGSSRACRRGSSTRSCTTASATANATALHDAPCLHSSTASGVSRSAPRRAQGEPPAALPRRRSSAWTSTPTGKGYWLVAADGGVFAFGDAHLPRSIGRTALEQPDRRHRRARRPGTGYWLVAADGGIFGFGDARLPRLDGRTAPQPPIVGHGGDAERPRLLAGRVRRRHLRVRRRDVLRLDGRQRHLNRPIVGMAATPIGQRLLARRVRRRHVRVRRRDVHGSMGSVKFGASDHRDGRDTERQGLLDARRRRRRVRVRRRRLLRAARGRRVRARRCRRTDGAPGRATATGSKRTPEPTASVRRGRARAS